MLAQSKNFSKTAAALFISQPSLTRHISALEQELGFTLFERNPTALTPAGQAFYEELIGIIDTFDRAVATSRKIAGNDTSPLIVNLIRSQNNQFSDIVFEAMAHYQNEHPFAPAPVILQDDKTAIEDTVIEGKADIGVTFTKHKSIPPEFAYTLMAELPLMLIVHEDNPLAQLQAVTWDDLQGYALIKPASPRLQSTFIEAVRQLRQHGIEPIIHEKEVSDFDRMAYLLQPDEILFKTEYSGQTPPATFLRFVPFADPKPSYGTYLIYRKDPMNPAIPEFITACKAIVTERLGKR